MAAEPSPAGDAVLRHAIDAARHTFRDADVVSAEPLGQGVGLLSSLTRVRFADGSSVVVKAPAGDATARAIAVRFGYYAREAGTYRWLLPRPGVRAPRCHAVLDEPHGPVLVLEDLGHLRSGDQLAGASVDDAFRAAEQLAVLHAAFWDDPVLAACTWLPGPTDPVIAGYGELFALTWDSFTARLAGRAPDEHFAAAQRAIGLFDDVCRRFADAPRTLLHGDARLDNLLFEPDGSAIAIDWQLAAWGRGVYDLALFSAGSLETDVRRACEDELVERYHRALVERGVTRYTLEECRRDYRLAHVLNLPNPVTALVAVPTANERARMMLEANARRALAAVADHEPMLADV
ncbi:MAG TPA: phosphotransferase [Acidimicrobiales bacterium]